MNLILNVHRCLVWFLTGLLFLLSAFGHAKGTLYELKAGAKEEKLVSYVQVYHAIKEWSPERILDSMNQETEVPRLSSTNFGFSSDFYWLKLDMKNPFIQDRNMVLIVRNPHLDIVKVWTQNAENVLRLIYVGGDGMPFYQRTVHNRNVIIPVHFKPKEIKTVLIQVDKRNASVSIPLGVMNQDDFENLENQSLFAFGVYFGVLLVIVIFALFIFYLLQQRIFFWYAIYLIFLGLYLLAHVGLLFQIGYPENYWMNDYSRPLFITFSSAALIHFIRLLLNIPMLLPSWNKVYSWMIFFLMAITIYWALTPWWHDVQTIVYLNVQNLTLLLSLLLVLITSVLTFNKQRVVVAFFWIAFMAILVAGISIILVESGWANESMISINPLFIGSIIEVLVFAVGLSYWSRINDAERIKLIGVVGKAQKEQVDSYIKGIEKEKSKISADLHDDIGSRLSHLKRQIERNYPDENGIIETLTQVNKKVRKLSHSLAPPQFERSDFMVSLKHLIQTHQTKEIKLNLQLFDLPKKIDNDISTQLYRIIQSSLSSIERHAKATRVEIQFFYHKNELILAIEDNGVGFIFNKNNPGLTMKDVLSRVELINGEIEISSSKNHGTSVMITVPILNNQ